MGNLIINDNLFLRQYEVEIEDDLAIIEYALQDRKIFLTKLVIPSSNKDENFEETFIREVFEIIKEKNIRIMPTAPQVRKFIKKIRSLKNYYLLALGCNFRFRNFSNNKSIIIYFFQLKRNNLISQRFSPWRLNSNIISRKSINITVSIFSLK